MHQSIVAQLKEKWGHVYNGFDATWRIWAAGILKQPLHTHSSAISLPPPANLLHLFERVPYGAEVRIEQAQQNFHLSTDIVNACLKDYDVLIRAAQDMLAASQEIIRRISSGIDVMNTKKKMLEAMAITIRPIDDANLDAILRSIPNTEDNEHAEA
ncbi:hypothetical protein AeMF1_021560 [Aphanomyces euteiches]|nr:hypothetical protein AeMF1_021560 [Aphanomyces euteiches]